MSPPSHSLNGIRQPTPGEGHPEDDPCITKRSVVSVGMTRMVVLDWRVRSQFGSLAVLGWPWWKLIKPPWLVWPMAIAASGNRHCERAETKSGSLFGSPSSTGLWFRVALLRRPRHLSSPAMPVSRLPRQRVIVHLHGHGRRRGAEKRQSAGWTATL